MAKKSFSFFLLIFFVGIIVSSCSSPAEKKVVTIARELHTEGQEPGFSFQEKENAALCLQDGKPLVYLFATTWCPHCKWIKETYTNVVQDYSAQGKIVASLWNIDIGDNVFTEEKEQVLPRDERITLQEFNPQQTIPTFVFGCKYYRVGNVFEGKGSDEQALAAEEKEFRAVIDKLLSEVEESTA